MKEVDKNKKDEISMKTLKSFISGGVAGVISKSLIAPI